MNRVSTGRDDPRDLLVRALEERWTRYRRTLRRCGPRASPDAIHDIRVSIRRLLAALDVARHLVPEDSHRKSRRLLKRRLETLSPLRDVQVVRALLRPLRPGFPATRSVERWLADRDRLLLREARREFQRRLHGGLRKAVLRSCRELWDRSGESGDDPPLHDLALRAWRETRAAAIRRRRALRARHPASFHRFRIAWKRLRYLAEILGPILPGAAALSLDRMPAVQDALGTIQDLDAAISRVKEFAQSHPADAAAQTPLIAELHRRRNAAMTAFLDRKWGAVP